MAGQGNDAPDAWMSVDVVTRTVSVQVATIPLKPPLYLPPVCLHRVSILARTTWEDTPDTAGHLLLTAPAAATQIDAVSHGSSDPLLLLSATIVVCWSGGLNDKERFRRGDPGGVPAGAR